MVFGGYHQGSRKKHVWQGSMMGQSDRVIEWLECGCHCSSTSGRRGGTGGILALKTKHKPGEVFKHCSDVFTYGTANDHSAYIWRVEPGKSKNINRETMQKVHRGISNQHHEVGGGGGSEHRRSTQKQRFGNELISKRAIRYKEESRRILGFCLVYSIHRGPNMHTVSEGKRLSWGGQIICHPEQSRKPLHNLKGNYMISLFCDLDLECLPKALCGRLYPQSSRWDFEKWMCHEGFNIISRLIYWQVKGLLGVQCSIVGGRAQLKEVCHCGHVLQGYFLSFHAPLL